MPYNNANLNVQSTFFYILLVLLLSHTSHIFAQNKTGRSTRRNVSASQKQFNIQKEKENHLIQVSYDSIYSTMILHRNQGASDSVQLEFHLTLAETISPINWRKASEHISKSESIYRKSKNKFSADFGFMFFAHIAKQYSYYSESQDSTELMYNRVFAFADSHEVSFPKKALIVFEYDDNVLSQSDKLINQRYKLIRETVKSLDETVHPNLQFRLKIRECRVVADSISSYDLLNLHDILLSYGMSKQDSIYPNMLALHAFNTANLYLTINEDERALALLDIATFLLEKALKNGQPRNSILKNKAYVISRKVECLIRLERYKEALTVSDTAIDIALNQIPKNVMLLSFLYQDRIPILFQLSLDKELQQAFIASDKYNEEHLQNKRTNKFLSFRSRGKQYFDCGFYTEAIALLEKAIEQGQGDLSELKVLLCIAQLKSGKIAKAQAYVNEFSNIQLEYQNDFDIRLAKYLIQFYISLYEQDRNEAHFIEINELVDHFTNTILPTFVERSFFDMNQAHFETLYEVFEQILRAHSERPFLSHERLFGLHDKVRGLDLWRDQLKNNAWTMSRIPNSALERRRNAVEQLNNLQNNYNNNLADFSSRMDSSRILYFSLLDSIKSLDQEYSNHQIPYESLIADTLRLAAVQSNLSPHECIISYMVGYGIVNVLAISQKGIYNYSLKNHLIKDCMLQIEKDTRNASPYTGNCDKQLYSHLLQPIVNYFDGKLSRIFIIPDQNLHGISFDCLVSSNGLKVVEKFATSTHLSIRLLNSQLRSAESKPHHAALIAFAPEYNLNPMDEGETSKTIAMLSRAGQYQLPGAKKEAKRISEIWHGKAMLDLNATTDNFKIKAENDNILHLAMHAVMNSNNPANSYLHFNSGVTDEVITASEISLMNINTPFVTLSACNTGAGNAHRGSSVKSIARGFLSAGVPSVLMSLWRVPDESTSELMISFYSHLATGVTKDVALQQAKLDYLNNVKDPALAHPYYWAGFVVFGDTHPLLPPKNNIWWWVLGGLVFLGVGYFVYKSNQ